MMIVRSVAFLGAMAMGASAAFAQRDNGGAVTHPAAIMSLLAEAHSPARDRRLYDLAVAIFKDIEADTVPSVTDARTVMARALHEAAEGGVPEAWIDYGRCLWNG
jgi:hypothetical protein